MGKRGPKTEEGKAKSLANLREPWQPGECPNPAGRPSAGLAIIEHLNGMQGLKRAEIEKIANDANAPVNQRVAAKRWLAADDGMGDDFDRLLDRTVGKSQQSKTVTHQGPGGGPVEVDNRLSFDHDGFAELYRRRRAVGGESGRAANGNGRH